MLQLTHKQLFHTLKKQLPDKAVIVEAGSFTGKDTRQLAQAWPQGAIYAFEPDPRIFKLLENNTQQYQNIHPFQLALSNKSGISSFWPSEHPKKPGVPSQAGSLLQPKERLKWSNIIFKDPISVTAVTLATWVKQRKIDHIDFLWLDLQGYELPVMQASKDLIKHISFIYTEVHFVEAYAGQAQYHELKSWLEVQGFTMIGKDFQYPSSWFFGNALFAKNHLK